MEVAARAQPGTRFEERAQDVLGGAGAHGGLQDHRGVRAQLCGQGASGRLHLAQVEPAVRAPRGGGADDRGAHPPELGRAGRVPEAPESIRRSSAGLREPGSGPVR